MADAAAVSVRIGPRTRVRLYTPLPGPGGKSIEHEFAACRPGGFFDAPMPDPFPAAIYAEWHDDESGDYCYGIVDVVPGGKGVPSVRWESVYQWMPVPG
jgi:hypothetical protein